MIFCWKNLSISLLCKSWKFCQEIRIENNENCLRLPSNEKGQDGLNSIYEEKKITIFFYKIQRKKLDREFSFGRSYIDSFALKNIQL